MLEEIINKLTNKFSETVFLKHENELEKQVYALEKLLEKYPNNNLLQNKLTICKLGLKGEQEIEFELKNANIGMYVIRDLNIEFENLKAQIDYFVITPAYSYFIECKNLLGNITVDQNGNFNRDYYINGKRIKEGIYNPLSQAQRHIEVYKKLWNSRNNSLVDKLLRKNNLDKWNKPLVVMANSKNILNLRYAPKDYKYKVIKSDNLVDYLKRDMDRLSSEYYIDQKQMKKIAETILAAYHKPVEVDYIQKFEEDFNLLNSKTQKVIAKEKPSDNFVKEKLVSYRKNKSTEKGIPAYYIFTNDELDKILALNPSTIKELEDAKILTSVKLKLHGKEIIDIINK